ncbi:MAG TPA: hypothetical protein VNI60_09080 [Pyrinomonadaceae bacterium]|nr:hypothetical protein [Pyrinomonadaceae bacterium]
MISDIRRFGQAQDLPLLLRRNAGLTRRLAKHLFSQSPNCIIINDGSQTVTNQ